MESFVRDYRTIVVYDFVMVIDLNRVHGIRSRQNRFRSAETEEEEEEKTTPKILFRKCVVLLFHSALVCSLVFDLIVFAHAHTHIAHGIEALKFMHDVYLLPFGLMSEFIARDLLLIFRGCRRVCWFRCFGH